MSEIRVTVRRPPASATWTFTRRSRAELSPSGIDIGLPVELSVTRTAGEGMTIRYGQNSIALPADLVDVLAEMVAKAAEWEDDQ